MRAIGTHLWGRIVELEGLAVVLLLPLWFNPHAELPFEPAKVTFLRWMVGATILTAVLGRLLPRWGSSSPSRSRWSWADLRAAFRANPQGLAVIAYGAAYLAATALSVHPRQSLWGSGDKHGTITVLTTLVFFFSLETTLKTRKQLSCVITALLVGTGPLGVYAFVQFLGKDPLDWVTDSVSPTLSTMGRSNFLGAYLAMVVPFTLLRLLNVDDRGAEPVQDRRLGRGGEGLTAPLAPGRKSWRAMVLGIFQVTCVLLSQARAAWLSLSAGVLVFLGLLAYRWRSRVIGLVWVSVALTGASLFVLSGSVDVQSLAGVSPPRAATELSYAELRTGTVHSRLSIWRHSLDLIPHRWLFGYGPENFAQVFDSRLVAGDEPIIVDDPHNLFLDQLISIGVLGLLAFAAVVGVLYAVTIRVFLRTRDRYWQALSAATLASATAFLIQAQFNPDVIAVWILFWVVLALASASAKLAGF